MRGFQSKFTDFLETLLKAIDATFAMGSVQNFSVIKIKAQLCENKYVKGSLNGD